MTEVRKARGARQDRCRCMAATLPRSQSRSNGRACRHSLSGALGGPADCTTTWVNIVWCRSRGAPGAPHSPLYQALSRAPCRPMRSRCPCRTRAGCRRCDRSRTTRVRRHRFPWSRADRPTQFAENAPIRGRMTGADFEHGSAPQPDAHDTVLRHWRAPHGDDGHGFDRSVVHTVNPVTDASNAISRSPAGVAVSVVGAAQTGQVRWFHCNECAPSGYQQSIATSEHSSPTVGGAAGHASESGCVSQRASVGSITVQASSGAHRRYATCRARILWSQDVGLPRKKHSPSRALHAGERRASTSPTSDVRTQRPSPTESVAVSQRLTVTSSA